MSSDVTTLLVTCKAEDIPMFNTYLDAEGEQYNFQHGVGDLWYYDVSWGGVTELEDITSSFDWLQFTARRDSAADFYAATMFPDGSGNLVDIRCLDISGIPIVEVVEGTDFRGLLHKMSMLNDIERNLGCPVTTIPEWLYDAVVYI